MLKFVQDRSKRMVWATAMVIAAAGSAVAQPGIFGIYNPDTGQFQPSPPVQMKPDAAKTSSGAVAPAATAARAGTIRIILVITVKNGTVATVKPNCNVGISHSPPGIYYSHSASVQGTRVGNAGQCALLIPYSWSHADTSQPVNIGVSAYVGNWSASVPVPSIPLPANGALTTVSVAITSCIPSPSDRARVMNGSANCAPKSSRPVVLGGWARKYGLASRLDSSASSTRP